MVSQATRIKHQTVQVFQNQALAADSPMDFAVDVSRVNAIHVDVYVGGASPSADITVISSWERGGLYNAIPDINGTQTAVAANTSFQCVVGQRWVRIRLANVTGNFTVYVTAFISAGSPRVSASISVDTLAAIQANIGAATIQDVLTMSAGGVIKSGQTAYDTGTGFWLEFNAGTPRLSLGSASGNKLTWDGTNLSITGGITATSGAFTGPITMSGASASIAIGSTPPTSATAGTGVWIDRTGLYGLAAGVQQAVLDATTGQITAGAGNVILENAGVRVLASTVYADDRAYKFHDGSAVVSGVYGYKSPAQNRIAVRGLSVTGLPSNVYLEALAPSGQNVAAGMTITSGATQRYAQMEYDQTTWMFQTTADDVYLNGSYLRVGSADGTGVAAGDVKASRHGTFAGGINVGSATGAGTGEIKTSGAIYPASLTNYYIGVSGSDVLFNFDANDYMLYARAGNVLSFTIGSSLSLQLIAGNRVRINTLTADGTVALYHNGSGDIGVVSSDARLKKDIEPIVGALSIVRAIQGVKYRPLEDIARGKKSLGVLAQDLLPVLPEAVFDFEQDGETYHGVHYEKLTALHNEAIKELAAIVEDQAIEIRAVKARIA